MAMLNYQMVMYMAHHQLARPRMRAHHSRIMRRATDGYYGGNQTGQWKIPYACVGKSWKIIYKWWNFHCHI